MDLYSIGASTCFDHIFIVENLPKEGSTTKFSIPAINRLEQTNFGGIAFNVATIANGLGLDVTVGYFVGKDFYKKDYDNYLERKGISLDGLITVNEKRCGHCYIVQDKQGNAFKMINTGASEEANKFEPQERLIREANMLLVNPVLNDYSLRATQIGQKAKTDVALHGFIRYRPKEFIQGADYIFMNETEFKELSQRIGLEEPRELLDLGPKALFMTQGSSGSKVFTSSRTYEIRKVIPHSLVDSTGAGDAYVGGVISGLLHGYSTDKSAKFGSVASSFILEQLGAQSNVPDKKSFSERFTNNFENIQLEGGE